MAGSPEPQRLSAADASNVVIDASDQVNAFLLAGTLGVGGFVSEGDVVDLDRLRAAIADRLGVPGARSLDRLSQRISSTGRVLAWVPCPPDLTWHVRLVDRVDGEEGLAALAATLMTVPLPLDRPRWELVVVPGAGPVGPGIILRLHHSVADGVAGVRLVQDLFGASPPHHRPALPSDASPAPRRRRGLRTLAASASRVTALFRATVPPTVLLGPIGPRRDVAFADVELDALRRAARAAGATVNDGLLSAVAVAAEAALQAGGHPVPPVLPASVPVALADRGTSGNAVGVMLVPLVTGGTDGRARLAAVAAATRSAKSEARAQGTFELTRTRWGSRLFLWLARRQRFIALFVTNVRGPDQRLHLAGAPLERAWPVAPIQGNVRLGVAAMSYAGRLAVAVHTDADAVSARTACVALGDELTRLAAGH